MVANAEGEHVGSLSGGCVEEDFLARLAAGEYELSAVLIRYGEQNDTSESTPIRLPCGGILDVLVERMAATPENLAHLEQLKASLLGEQEQARHIRLTNGKSWLEEMEPTGPRVVWQEGEEVIKVRIGPIGLDLGSKTPVEIALAIMADIVRVRRGQGLTEL